MTAVDDRRGADLGVADLYAAHARGLVRLAWLLLHDEQDAEEVVQDAFVAVHRHWGRLRDEDSAAAYLRRSVVNGARSALRRRGVRERYAAALRAERRTAVSGSAEDVVADAALHDYVVAALSRLPQRQREVLVLRYYLDLPEAQIADQLGLTRGAVHRHATRATEAMRTHLGHLGEAP